MIHARRGKPGAHHYLQKSSRITVWKKESSLKKGDLNHSSVKKRLLVLEWEKEKRDDSFFIGKGALRARREAYVITSIERPSCTEPGKKGKRERLGKQGSLFDDSKRVENSQRNKNQKTGVWSGRDSPRGRKKSMLRNFFGGGSGSRRFFLKKGRFL